MGINRILCNIFLKNMPQICHMWRGLRMVARALWNQRHTGLCLGRRPCTSRRRGQGRSQDTTLSASDLHNARTTILNPFYNMECKKDKINWSGHYMQKSHFKSVQCTRPSHCLRQQWHHDPIQFHNVTIANTENLTASARGWHRSRFEIYGSAVEHNFICLRTAAKP